jgi:hypothetical protein
MNFPKTAMELQQLLEERKLYPWHASANGEEPYEGCCLKQVGNQWVVFDTGPAVIARKMAFDNESDAVANLIERMRKDVFASYFADL